MTTMWPIAAAVAPPPANRDSSTVTESPASDSASAHAAPTMPAPTTRTSGDGMGPQRSPCRNGSRGSKKSVVFPVMNARPWIRGIERAVALLEPAGEQAAADGLLAVARRRSRAAPRAWSDAMRAEVPVPQGDRSYAPPGTHHVVPAVRVRPRGRAEQDDVVDELAAGAAHALRGEGLLDRERDRPQPLAVAGLDGLAGQLGQEEPVAAVGDVADDAPDARHVHGEVARVAPRGHVLDRDEAVHGELGAHRPHGRVELHRARARCGRGARACARRRSCRGRTSRAGRRCRRRRRPPRRRARPAGSAGRRPARRGRAARGSRRATAGRSGGRAPRGAPPWSPPRARASRR